MPRGDWFLKPFYTPLRYPGGKGRLAQFFGELIELNGLSDGTYVEPYAGGAGAAIALLFLEYVRRVYLNDLNRGVFAFWHSTLFETEQLCKLIQDRPVTMREWRRQQSVHRDPTRASLLELGYSTLFLNRTNRSGILDGGVIGGKQQTGEWKLDARYNKKDLVNRIQRIARCSSRIEVSNVDASKFIQESIPALPGRVLTYLDPPYYNKGKHLYDNHYGHEDHVSVAKLIQHGSIRNWVVSYDNAPEIKEMYRDRRRRSLALNYTAQSRYSGVEVLFFSDNMRVPRRVAASRSVYNRLLR